MADRYFAELQIPIWALKHPAVKSGIEYECPSDAEEYGTVYSISDGEASWGEFETLEGVLRELRIPFDRHSGRYDEIAPISRYLRFAEDGTPVEKDVCEEETKIDASEAIKILDKEGATRLREILVDLEAKTEPLKPDLKDIPEPPDLLTRGIADEADGEITATSQE